MKKIWIAVFGLFCLASAVKAETFTFTAIPDEDESRLRSRFDKVAVYLSKQLGVDAAYVPVKSYEAAVAAFVNNQVQLAWFGGLSGVRARARVPGSEAIAQGVEDKAFVTYFIANAATGLNKSKDFPDQIKGKTLTFGDKGSTSGRLMPEYFIREHYKKAPEEIFARVGFSGDHSKTIQLVQSGAYQVGALNFKAWENDLKAGKIDEAKVKIIWETPSYPDYQWTIRGEVDQTFGGGFKNKVKQALLGMKDQGLLASFPRAGFISAANSDYQPIEEVGKKIGLLD